MGVEPELVFNAPGWDDQLLADLGDSNVSIETAITIVGDTLWFANSGGLVQAWDIAGLREGVDPVRTFRFWAGDDIDASIVIDDEGYAYVGVELERAYSRAVELASSSSSIGETRWQTKLPGPVWSSPVVVDDVLIQADCSGFLRAWDVADTARDPRALWTIGLPWCIESTPAVWDGQIFVGHRRGEVWAIGDAG